MPQADIRRYPQIKKLTETFGVPLFEQVGNRIYLTEAGQRLYAGCNEMFRVLSNLEQTLAEMRGLASGQPAAGRDLGGAVFRSAAARRLRPAQPGDRSLAAVPQPRHADRAPGEQRGRPLHVRRAPSPAASTRLPTRRTFRSRAWRASPSSCASRARARA